jgi:class 3 adenylate cyclase
MRVSIFIVMLILLTLASVVPAGFLFWTTFGTAQEIVKYLFDDRTGLWFDMALERINPALSPAELSREVDSLGRMIGRDVLVLDANGKVVAHRLIASGAAEPGSMPAQVDPILGVLMREEPVATPGPDTRLWETEINDDIYFLEMRALKRPKGWQVGLYGSQPELVDLRHMKWWLYRLCTATLVMAIVLAFVFSRTLSRPLRRVARMAGDIGRFELDVDPLPTSWLAEVDQTDRAMNTMVSSLRWFTRYVPREVVRRLMTDPEAGKAEERELTILFTDIAGFTEMSEAMTPLQIADFTNHHLSIVTACIQKEGGVVDKFIGDAVMAFFGAPEPLTDHGIRGCRAALAIRRAIEADNATRRKMGLPPVRVRVGVHMGSAIVGNIGSEDRVNYSIIGDAVNVAARLESQGKEYGDLTQEVSILASEDALTAAGMTSDAIEVGTVQLRGRIQAMRVYRL